MELKGKALFNLLKINALDDPRLAKTSWQIEELRGIDTQELFARLKKMGITLDETSFSLYADEVDSPEDLVECLWDDEEDLEGHDQVYLMLFELWRRLLPKKQSLSVFCDELDYLIEQYDRGELEDEEPLQNALSLLEDILDDTSDQDGNPQQIFAEVCAYCAHDLESFIYDYITDQIEAEDETYASELLDAYYDFVTDKKWFDFLRARIFSFAEGDEAEILIERLLEQLREEPSQELLVEIIENLVHHGHAALFRQAVKQALPQVKTEKELGELLTMLADFYRCLDREEKEKEVQQLIQERVKKPAQLHPKDEILHRFVDLLEEV